MKTIQSIPFVWLPLLTLWTIIFVLFRNLSVDNIEVYIPLVIYIPVSFIFSAQYGLLLKDKKEFLFTKLSSSTSIIICFLISTISIFYYLYGKLDFQRSLFFIVLPLVANLIINEFISLSNKKLVTNKKQWEKRNIEIEDEQIQRSKENATSREIYLSYKKQWKTFLKKELKNTDEKDEKYILEIKRIMDIVEYSSYFRNSDSIEDLDEIKKSKDLNFIKKILKQIK
tara:strand:+ start:31 stop:711 length:681 start_codon:yes stop_codon:yes gene_type:complete